MIPIPPETRHFFDRQHYMIVSSREESGAIHTSAKGIVKVDPKGKIFLLDLYRARTYANIRRDRHVTLTAVDDRRFRGFSVEGIARIVREGALPKSVLKIWHERLAKRIARRIISHVKEERHAGERIPEAKFPVPKHLIEVRVEKIVDLAPQPAKRRG
jgi:general stress protein 26